MPEEGNNVHGICAPSKYETEHVSQGDYIGITIPGTKSDLTYYVCSGLLEYCSSNSTCNLIVVGDIEIMGQDCELIVP